MRLYMVIEHFRNGDAVPVYRRFRERGRMAPEGLNYISSWVDDKLATCYQVMETADPGLLDEWMRHRLRAIQLKHWGRPATVRRELRALGASEDTAKQVAANVRRW